ncbi:orotidine-5'-phosphate decarboxylase [Arcanobacterium ihumii]|uniref:orotidine-5'-phosphate decarboxylase n=1 Tax=Arcanobacterium ihumii TaxID=2138162 RepID=UPI000F5302D4|nr:orotidine-5'-phosphate decarboxylase [Arcanobacterium ihumii]
MAKDVIVACDFPSKERVFEFLDLFGSSGYKPYVKIGMELFYSEGPQIVRALKRRGHQVFLDLKLHDIPNTVERTMRVLSDLNVDMCNVHAMGSGPMMRAALEGCSSTNDSRPVLIAITQLTSTDQETMERDLLIKEPLANVVSSYAKNAQNAGLDGVVCSPLEAREVHKSCGAEFLTVTPGIRLAHGEAGDQRRVMTPRAACEAGSDYIVVGRPITAASDPVAAYEYCIEEFLGND